MDKKTFLKNFGVIADAPNGIPQIRKVCLALLLKKAASASDSRKGVSIKEICQVDWGDTSKTKSSYVDGGKFLAVSAAGPDGRIDSASNKALTPVLSAIGAQCGRMFMPTEDFTAIKNTMVINPDESQIRPWFLYYLFTSETLPKRGSAQPFMTKGDVQAFEIVLPSIPSQDHAITQIIQLMALCDELDAEKAKREKLRTAARASAIDAISTATTPEELSAAWSRISNNWELVCDSFDSISSLRTLLVDLSIQGQLFGRQELGEHGYPKKWDVPNFKELCDIEGGNQPPKSTFVAEPRAGYVQLFQIRDLGSNPVPVFIPEEMAKSTAKEGDILIGRYGASVGKVFRAQDGAYNVALVKFIYPKDRLNPDFVFWLLKSTRSQALFTGMTRSAQAGFNKRDLAPLLIPIPSLEEQVRIVSRLNELMMICGDLEGRLKKRTEIESAFAAASSQLLTV